MGYKTEFTTHIACTTEWKMQHDKSQTYFDKGALENIQPKAKVVYPEKNSKLAQKYEAIIMFFSDYRRLMTPSSTCFADNNGTLNLYFYKC